MQNQSSSWDDSLIQNHAQLHGDLADQSFRDDSFQARFMY